MKSLLSAAVVVIVLVALGLVAWRWIEAAAARDAWIAQTNRLAAQDTAKSRAIEGLNASISELQSFVARSADELATLTRDTSRLARENRRLKRETAVLVRSEGTVRARLDSAEVALAEIAHDTLQLQTEARKDFAAGHLDIQTRAKIPLDAPAHAFISHDVSGAFAVATRLVVEEDGTPVCQLSVPGDVFALRPSVCGWRDMRPGPADLELPALRLSAPVGGVVGGLLFVAGYLVGRI